MKTIVNKLPDSNVILADHIPQEDYPDACFIANKKGRFFGIIRASSWVRNFQTVIDYCFIDTPHGFARGPDTTETIKKVSIEKYIKLLIDNGYEVIMFDDFYEMAGWIAKNRPTK